MGPGQRRGEGGGVFGEWGCGVGYRGGVAGWWGVFGAVDGGERGRGRRGRRGGGKGGVRLDDEIFKSLRNFLSESRIQKFRFQILNNITTQFRSEISQFNKQENSPLNPLPFPPSPLSIPLNTQHPIFQTTHPTPFKLKSTFPAIYNFLQDYRDGNMVIFLKGMRGVWGGWDWGEEGGKRDRVGWGGGERGGGSWMWFIEWNYWVSKSSFFNEWADLKF